MKAENQKMQVPPTSTGSDVLSKLLQQYGCGPIPLVGADKR
jgi:hypothetical protein